ncbi:Mutanase [Colletotrichum siamense]|nr:Mutanase [Colletotrichum siamense]
MRLLLLVTALLSWILQVRGKAVFAHFMVGNTAEYTDSDWADDINKAKEAHIDAFALNMAQGEEMNDKSVKAVFAKAEQLGFQLFFSFDYAGNGPWKKQVVIDMLKKYSSSPAHFRHEGKPFVSTFEGPAQADDWIDIKAQTGCFFVPDWSSDGAKRAMERAGGVADGLFSWDSWAWGGHDMDTYTDASYDEFLGGKPYMMPVSPWFYTNMPGFGKNWLWRGDHAWYDRWVQVNWWQPEWVQIISWNDYGESHHIGPVRDHALVAFKTGKSPYNYALDRPHDAWRTLLPFTIDLYKHNTATITQEGVEFWYRRVYRKDCNDGGTTGNTASQVQLEYKPSELVSDEVFFSALLTEEAELHVVIGGSAYRSTWRNKPEGGAGIYHGGVPFDGREGGVEIRLIRGGKTILSVTGPDVGRNCGSDGYHNFNPTTGGKMMAASRSVTVPSLSNQICIGGWGANDFSRLCKFTCSYGYCPKGACVCTALGTEFEYPNGTGPPGFALEGRGSSYAGLCSSACSYGFCPEEACGLTEHPLIEPMVSPFQPPACVSGTGPGDLAALCSFTCRHGFCPIAACTCLSQGELDWLDPTVDLKAGTVKDDGHGLCAFACSRGYCPFDKCVQRVIGDQGSQDGGGRDIGVVNLNQTCFRSEKCVDIEDDINKLGYSKACGQSYKRVGWDKSICSGIGGNWGQPICCKATDAPEKCMWRGNGGDCNGQCHEGEVTLYKSGNGGWPVESGGNNNQCSRGYKYFCCSMDSYDELTDQCYWSGCEESCKGGEHDVATAVSSPDQTCNLFKYMSHYCCKSSQPPLRSCHWVGKGDCADNTCSATEVTVRTNSQGDSLVDCLWGRKKALCCTPNGDVFDTPTCGGSLCDYPGSGFNCDEELYADDYSDEDECEPAFCPSLDRRGSKRPPFIVAWEQVINGIVRKFRLELQMRGAPGSSNLHRATRSTPASNNVFRMAQNDCRSTEIEVLDRSTMSSQELRKSVDTEHNPDGQYTRDFVRTMATGILPNGSTTTNGPMHGPDLADNWNAEVLPANLPRAGSSHTLRTPNGYLFDRFGSQGNREPFVLCERVMNQMKGRIYNLRQPSPKADNGGNTGGGSGSGTNDPDSDVGERPGIIGDERFQTLLINMLTGDVAAQTEMFDSIRMAIGVFRYINHPDALPTVQRNRREIRAAVIAIAKFVRPLSDAAAIHREFDSNWYREGADRTRAWVAESILEIRLNFGRLERDGNLPPNAAEVQDILDALSDQIHYIQPPPDI